MNEPTINGNTIEIPVKYLLKKFKKCSGYKEAKKRHGLDNLHESLAFDSDYYICAAIDNISDQVSGCRFRYPNSKDVHAAFRALAPYMFKSAFDEDDPFIFKWLKRPYADLFNETISTNTEIRIRILKLILLVNPSAVLSVKLTPIDN